MQYGYTQPTNPVFTCGSALHMHLGTNIANIRPWCVRQVRRLARVKALQSSIARAENDLESVLVIAQILVASDDCWYFCMVHMHVSLSLSLSACVRICACVCMLAEERSQVLD